MCKTFIEITLTKPNKQYHNILFKKNNSISNYYNWTHDGRPHHKTF